MRLAAKVATIVWTAVTGTAQTAVRPALVAAVLAMGELIYQTSKAQHFGIAQKQFQEWALAIAQKYLPPEATQSEAEDFLGNLRLEDLALARACAAGHERAWEQFMARFRECCTTPHSGLRKNRRRRKTWPTPSTPISMA